MRQVNNIFDLQQIIKDLQDQLSKKLDFLQNQINAINPKSFFIANETGANNAIQGGIPVALKPGLVVNVLLSHTLQIGANTFNNKPIVNASTLANSNKAYSIGGIIQLCYSGTQWLDLSQ